MMNTCWARGASAKSVVAPANPARVAARATTNFHVNLLIGFVTDRRDGYSPRFANSLPDAGLHASQKFFAPAGRETRLSCRRMATLGKRNILSVVRASAPGLYLDG